MLTENADKTFSATIDDKLYRFTRWDADKSFRVLAELSACIGEGLNLGQMAIAQDNLSQKVSLATMAAKALMSGIGSDPERSLRLVKRLCCDGVFRDDRKLREQDFGQDYSGDMMHVFSVSVAALEVHFERFFILLRGLLATVQRQPQTSSPSSTTP